MKTTIAIMGPTGAGKDTQARLLVEKYDYHILDTGDLVRAQMEDNLELTHQITQGLLADDMLVNDLVAGEIDKLTPHERLISDGFPRRLVQAEWFDQYLAEAGRELDTIIYLSLADKVILERLAKRGRVDDHADAVQRRLDIFATETKPVLEYFERRDLVHEVNGNQSVEVIHDQIMEHLS